MKRLLKGSTTVLLLAMLITSSFIPVAAVEISKEERNEHLDERFETFYEHFKPYDKPENFKDGGAFWTAYSDVATLLMPQGALDLMQMYREAIGAHDDSEWLSMSPFERFIMWELYVIFLQDEDLIEPELYLTSERMEKNVTNGKMTQEEYDSYERVRLGQLVYFWDYGEPYNVYKAFQNINHPPLDSNAGAPDSPAEPAPDSLAPGEQQITTPELTPNITISEEEDNPRGEDEANERQRRDNTLSIVIVVVLVVGAGATVFFIFRPKNKHRKM